MPPSCTRQASAAALAASQGTAHIVAMDHVVLLGDSVFDNGSYVPGHPDVVQQLRAHLPGGWRATLLAVDGHATSSVHAQLDGLPGDASHLVLSAGGNDALMQFGILDAPVRSMSTALDTLAGVRDEFAGHYRPLIAQLVGTRLHCAVCTVYEGNFKDAGIQRLAATALTVFNDVIIRTAVAAGLPVIDLRAICSTAGDYANPIEPSPRGGDRIARTIARVLARHDFAAGRTAIFGGDTDGRDARGPGPG
jgi:hypothetical protein